MRFDPSASTAVIVPVHNRREKTSQCIESLQNGDGPPVTLIVVDDGSTDGTAEYLASRSDIVTITGSGDLWWTASVEAGCRHAVDAGAEVIVLLNDDNVVAPNLIATLSHAVQRTGGCVGAAVLETLPSGVTVLFQSGGTLDWRGRGIGLRRTGAPYVASDELERCDWLPGCALAFPASLYVELGGFDAQRFPQYRGDIDFTLRARERGYACFTTLATWVLNDRADSPLTFQRRVRLRTFLGGFVNRRSNYNLRETVRFAWKYCPRRLVLYHLVQFYARYTWASLKTQRYALSAHE